MEDFKLTKKPDLGIFDRQFPVLLESTPIHDATKMTIIQGTDGVLDDLFSYQVYNKLKNHWRLDVEPADKQVGMIWSESGGNDKLFHYGEVGGDAWEEILQRTRSSDVTPEFLGLLLAEYITHDGNADTYFRFQDDQITLRAGGVDFINIVEAATDYLALLGGKVFIGDNANANITIGLTINQVGYDDEIFALKSSDVGHGYTAAAETDTFGTIAKRTADYGGMQITSYSEDDAANIIGFRLSSYGGRPQTTKSTAGRGLLEFYVSQISGNAPADIAADGNVLSIRYRKGGGDITGWILDEDGDVWQGGNLTGAGAFYIEAGAAIYSHTIADDTTVSLENVYIDSVTGHLYRSTSGGKYKNKIKDMELDSSKLYQLRPVSFNSLCKGDDKDKRFHGLNADEVEKIYPEIVVYGANNEVENYDHRMIMTLMLAETQHHEIKITDHETRIKALEAQLNN